MRFYKVEFYGTRIATRDKPAQEGEHTAIVKLEHVDQVEVQLVKKGCVTGAKYVNVSGVTITGEVSSAYAHAAKRGATLRAENWEFATKR